MVNNDNNNNNNNNKDDQNKPRVDNGLCCLILSVWANYVPVSAHRAGCAVTSPNASSPCAVKLHV